MKILSNNFIKYIKTILSPIKYSPKIFSIYFFTQIFDGFQSIFVVVIITKIISSLENSNIGNLYFWIYIFIGLIAFSLIITLFEDSLYSLVYNKINRTLTKKYLKDFIYFDNTKVEEYGTGKLNNIIFSGIEAIIHLIDLLLKIFIGVFSIIYMFIIIFTKSPNIYYSIGFTITFSFVVLFFAKGIKEISKIRKEAKDLYIEVDSKKVKILMSKFEILQNNKIDRENKNIEEIIEKIGKMWWTGNLKKSMWGNFSIITLKSLYLAIFLIIGVGVINKNYDIATFALLIWLLDMLSNQAWSIRGYMRDFMSSFIDVEKLVDTFENIPKYKDDSNLPDFQYKKGDIVFENVNFSYNEKALVFDNFSLKLDGGKKYAFVGLSGSGKSTFLKLLAGYIEANSGEIIIDKQKLSEIKLKTYYKNIGYLSQEPSVFDGKIYENLVYALDYEPDSEKIKEIIKLSKCEFIYDLKDSINTEIGERGVKLSGGQKQRLAIAKIMLKNPSIILLDEPTSALDSFNEEEISIALNNLFKNKTVIIVAHRLQTVKNADKIFYMEDGKIIEEGNHQELLNKKGKYYNMIELQSGF